MKKNLLGLIEKATDFSKKNSPAILAGLAIVGVVTTAIVAYKASPKADEILKEHKKNMDLCHANDKKAKKSVRMETVKKLAPVMAPPIVMGGVTIACIAGTHSASARRIAALSAAYNLSENTVKNLNNKMEEMLGKKKTREIKDAIMKDKLDASKNKPKDTIIMSGNGDVLCKDLYTGHFFYSNAEKINQAIAKCSFRILSEMYISLNDFYDEINSPNLERTRHGDDLGWNLDDCDDGHLPIQLTAILTDDNKPCLCLDYDINVRADFRDLH